MQVKNQAWDTDLEPAASFLLYNFPGLLNPFPSFLSNASRSIWKEKKEMLVNVQQNTTTTTTTTTVAAAATTTTTTTTERTRHKNNTARHYTTETAYVVI